MASHIIDSKPYTFPVKMSTKTHDAAKTYSELTGIPEIEILSEAVEDWMDTVGAARIEIAQEHAAATA